MSQQKTDGEVVNVSIKCHKCGRSDVTVYPIDIGTPEEQQNVMMCEPCILEYDREVSELERKAQVRSTLNHLREISEIPVRYKNCSFDNFHLPKKPNDYLFTQKEAASVLAAYGLVLKYIEAIESGEPQVAIFTGSVGTGKTHLAVACLNRIIDAGSEAKFYHASSLIRAFMDNEAYQTLMREVLSNKLILIDDITTAPQSDFTRRTLSDIIDQCYSSGVSVIMTFQDMTNTELKDKYLDYRGIDRTQDSPAGGIIKFKWRSVRGRLEENAGSDKV